MKYETLEGFLTLAGKVKVVSFHTVKTVDTAFKANKYCFNKKEGDVITDTLPEILSLLKEKEEQITFIKKMINENNEANIIALCALIYPHLPINKAIDEVYNKLKQLQQLIGDSQSEPITKFIKIDKEKLEEIMKLPNFEVKAPLAFFTKVAYVKRAIEAIDNVCL